MTSTRPSPRRHPRCLDVQLAVRLLTAAAALTPGLSRAETNDGYVDPPPVGTYPATSAQVEDWIARMDQPAIRRHGWDVWASITRAVDKQGTPAWETWYSGQEVFSASPPNPATRRKPARDFESPRQHHHHSGPPKSLSDHPERVVAFNRFTRSLATNIWARGYHKAATLDAINRAFDGANTPVGNRAISTSSGLVDASQIALKPVFQFIDGTQPTPVPYWAGISTRSTTNLANPTPESWRQCVVVDPTGQLRPGSTHPAAFNAEPAAERTVVALDDFFHLRLTREDVAAFSQFALASGDDVGLGNQTDPKSLAAMIKPGNIALLVAMHVTTKETTNWTWQTFWWSPTPNLPPYGHDRTPEVRQPWNHYAMDTAYFMTIPANDPAGQPLIAFNPYLETNLQGSVHTPEGPVINWTGPDTNCMSCHRMAAWKQRTDRRIPRTPEYHPDGFISPDDPALFGDYTKLDFLWSITRAK